MVLKAGYWIEAFQYDVCFARLWQKWVHDIFPEVRSSEIFDSRHDKKQVTKRDLDQELFIIYEIKIVRKETSCVDEHVRNKSIDEYLNKHLPKDFGG
jgi:hypothetical protein